MRVVPDAELWPLLERYEGCFGCPPISYGTARDMADSAAALAGLAGASFDMKGLQRCWAVKAILGNVKRGSRLLEIGAGEPLVAGLLSRLGYEVTVVDPYDGSGNGPREHRVFTDEYRDLRFVREQFPPRETLEPGFAGVYSISVLEHVPGSKLDAVVGEAEALLADGGCQIHAVDHVLAGWGAEDHLDGLRRLVAALAIPAERLTEALGEAERDPETYFVSAEAHNLWRGALAYDDYRMRRIISINLVTRKV